MSSKVVGHVIGVATWQRCTYGADLQDRKWMLLMCAHLTASSSGTNTGLAFGFSVFDSTVPAPSANDTAATPSSSDALTLQQRNLEVSAFKGVRYFFLLDYLFSPLSSVSISVGAGSIFTQHSSAASSCK